MNAKKCDRCGRYFEREQSGKYAGQKLTVSDFPEDVGDPVFHENGIRVSADLCDLCSISLLRWLDFEGDSHA